MGREAKGVELKRPIEGNRQLSLFCPRLSRGDDNPLLLIKPSSRHNLLSTTKQKQTKETELTSFKSNMMMMIGRNHTMETQLEVVAQPLASDVLCGKNKECMDHPGTYPIALAHATRNFIPFSPSRSRPALQEAAPFEKSLSCT